MGLHWATLVRYRANDMQNDYPSTLGRDERRRLERIEKKLDVLLVAAGIEIQLEVHMDAAGEALQNQITSLDSTVAAENEEVVKTGEAVVKASAKIQELKELAEKAAAGAALSDDEATKLTALATEAQTHLGEATTQLTSHVGQLEAADA